MGTYGTATGLVLVIPAAGLPGKLLGLSGGELQAYFDSDGKIKWAAGKGILDESGFSFTLDVANKVICAPGGGFALLHALTSGGVGYTYAIYGSDSGNAAGVGGNSVSGTGIIGIGGSIGVFGKNIVGTGNNVGVQGIITKAGGLWNAGVLGAAGYHNTYGIRGHLEDYVTGCIAVFGETTDTSPGGNVGLKGLAYRDTDIGVLGSAFGANGVAVKGVASDPCITGVQGSAEATDGIGVDGIASGEMGIGVLGRGSGDSGVGVKAVAEGTAQVALEISGGFVDGGSQRYTTLADAVADTDALNRQSGDARYTGITTGTIDGGTW